MINKNLLIFIILIGAVSFLIFGCGGFGGMPSDVEPVINSSGVLETIGGTTSSTIGSTSDKVPPAKVEEVNLLVNDSETVKFSWERVLANNDSTPCTDLKGYKIYKEEIISSSASSAPSKENEIRGREVGFIPNFDFKGKIKKSIKSNATGKTYSRVGSVLRISKYDKTGKESAQYVASSDETSISTFFEDTDIVKGKIYEYRVVAEDTNGNLGQPSNSMRIEVPLKGVSITSSPHGGEFYAFPTITLEAEKPFCTIYYTIDGTIPTTSSNIYTKPINLSGESVTGGDKITKSVKFFTVNKYGLVGPIQNEIYTVLIASAVASPKGNSYSTAQNIEIKAPDGALIYYAINELPTEKDQCFYTKPVYIDSSCTLYYFSKFAGGLAEVTKSEVYTIDANLFSTFAALASTPTTPITENIVSNKTESIKLVCRNNGSSEDKDDIFIYYTLDGTTPSTSSNVYQGLINITSSCTLKYFAKETIGILNSEPVKSLSFTIDKNIPSSSCSPTGGTSSNAVTVTLSCDKTGSSMYYTTDGTVPSSASTKYSSSFIITNEGVTILKYFAIDTLGNQETVNTAYFTIDTIRPITTVSKDSGNYSNEIYLNLAANETSTIYYTLNVETINTSSPVYDSDKAITLENQAGDYTGTTWTLRYFSKDTVGNKENTGTKTYVIDNTAPTVVSVSADKGTPQKEDAEINIVITFTEKVFVTGTPQLTLDLGAGYVIDYVSGSGTNGLSFKYTVQAGQNTEDLAYKATTSFVLNGGTIKDSLGNNAVLTLPTPGAANSLSGTLDLIIDTTIPTVTNITSSKPDAMYMAGVITDTVIPISISFSEKVTATNGAITLATGGAGVGAGLDSGSNTTEILYSYTVQSTHNSADLDYLNTTSLTGTIVDRAGNYANLTLPSPGAANSLGNNKAIKIDNTKPTVTEVKIKIPLYSIDKAIDTDPTGLVVPEGVAGVYVTFSEPIKTNTPTISIDQPGTSDITKAAMTRISDTQYSFAYNIFAHNGTTSVDGSTEVSIYQARDLAVDNGGAVYGNMMDSDENNYFFTINTQGPTVTSLSVAEGDGWFKEGQTLNIEVRFTSAVNVSGGTPILVLETGTNDATASYSSGTGSNELIFQYTVNAGDTSSDLNQKDVNSLMKNGATVRDVFLHDADFDLTSAVALATNNNVIIDTTAPNIIGVSCTNADGAYGLNASVEVTVTFNENINVMGTPRIELDIGAGYNVNFTSVAGAVLSFNYTVQSGHTVADLAYTGTSALQLNGGTIKDEAGNNAVLVLPAVGTGTSLSGSKNIEIDTTAPSITDVQLSGGNNTISNGETITITFDARVKVGGTPADDSLEIPAPVGTSLDSILQVGDGADFTLPPSWHTFENAGNLTASFNAAGTILTITVVDKGSMSVVGEDYIALKRNAVITDMAGNMAVEPTTLNPVLAANQITN